MKIILFISMFLALFLFSCKKEEIRPNETSPKAESTCSCTNNAKSNNGHNNNGIGCDDEDDTIDTITDPNNDEDEFKRTKRKK